MKNTSETQRKIPTIIGWISIALLTAMTLFSHYYFGFKPSIMILIWLGWFICCFGLLSITNQGRQLFTFASESKLELQKVVWPSRHETIQTTGIVMIMVTVTGFVLWGIDSCMTWAIGKLTHLG